MSDDAPRSPSDGPRPDGAGPGGSSSPLAGSHRRPAPGARPLGPVPDDEPVRLTLVLRRRQALPAALVTGAATVSRAELAQRYGADPADVDLVTSVLSGRGLTVDSVEPASRRVVISGPAGTVAAAFGTTLEEVVSTDPVTGGEVTHRGRTGTLTVPEGLDRVVVAVLGLDDRPQANTRFRLARPGAVATSYTPPQLGLIYEFPPDTDGAGQTLAIVELGGGFDEADLDTYFAQLGVRRPAVRAVGVDGADNQPGGDPTGADGEVLLDIEVAGALAPGAAQLVYFAPNTDRGFVDAVSTAVHADPTPTVVSISWGQSEPAWTAQGRTALDDVFLDAAALGVTVCVAAGDSGSSDGDPAGRPTVDYPAASPYVLACGGTRLQADPATGAVGSEVVWGGAASRGSTGGGVSGHYPRPAWQAGAGVPDRPGGGTGRGVPDVAADADPATGYEVRVDGQTQVVGGTSAVAPLWAALLCRVAQSTGRRSGLLQPAVYPSAGGAAAGFRDITEGTNGKYPAGPGWDACTGLGVPVGTALLTVLAAATAPTTGPGAAT